MEMKSIFKTMVMAALCLGTVTFASCVMTMMTKTLD